MKRGWQLGLVGVFAVAVAATVAPGGARAALPDGVIFDDTYVQYEAVNHGSISNNVPSDGWHLRARGRLLGAGVAPNSALVFVVKQGRRELGRKLCPLRGEHVGAGVRSPAPHNLHVVRVCQDTDQRFTATGEVTVEVRFLDDATESESVLRTHTIDVRRVSRENGSGDAQPGEYIVSHHGHVPAMLLEQYEGYSGSSARTGQNGLYLYAWTSPTDRPDGLTLRCEVDGTYVAIPNDRVGRGSEADVTVSEIRRIRGQRRTEREKLRFAQFRFELPLTFGDNPRQMALDVGAHPGAWECKLRNRDRQTIRVIRFRVQDGGVVAPHPEQAAGLVLPEGWVLVDGDVPADNPLDARTDPAAARAGAFYGRPWATAEGRAMAGRLPRIGDPYPPSARGRRR